MVGTYSVMQYFKGIWDDSFREYKGALYAYPVNNSSVVWRFSLDEPEWLKISE